MCFAPQRRALFRHLNFQKWSEPLVFLTFWLRHVLRATTACTFSTSQLPKVVREWCALHILTSKCASRRNGVHFFDISTSKSAPRMVCFVHFSPNRFTCMGFLLLSKGCIPGPHDFASVSGLASHSGCLGPHKTSVNSCGPRHPECETSVGRQV